MKTKLLITCYVLFLQTLAFAQPATNPSSLPYVESFNYPVGGNLIGLGDWTNATSGTVDETIVDSPVLNYAGLPASTGGALSFIGGGSDPIKYFIPQTEGTLYYSFLVSISDNANFVSATGDPGIQFISLGLQSSTPANSNYGACVFVRKNTSDGSLNLGLTLDSTSSNTQWLDPASTPISFDTTYLIVISYTFDASAPTGKMWVNPVISTTEPAATLTSNVITNNRTTLDRVYIRQDANAKTPTIVLDELRVATSWEEVVTHTLSVSSQEFAKVSMSPNPAKSNFAINTNGLEIDLMTIYNIDGKVVLQSNTVISNESIDISTLSTGVYFVKLNSDKNSITRKLIVK